MIGYYVHHVGRGHVTRAEALADAVGGHVTVLSSLPQPRTWRHGWVQLPRDDGRSTPVDVTAGGALHWAPRLDPGNRSRMATMSRWIEERDPCAFVVDVSVEAAVLARLHGVPVVSVVLPGDRGDDAHRLGYRVSDALVGFWPPQARGVVRGLTSETARRVEPLGALSRFAPAPLALRPEGRRQVALLLGSGGHAIDEAAIRAARASSPGWTWVVLDGSDPAQSPADVASVVSSSTVVVTHAGESALAEVAALRRPAVVVPQERPHAEQACTAEVLATGDWPVQVEPTFPVDGWSDRLDRVAGLDSSAWSSWCDGLAARRFAAVLDRVIGRQPTTEVA